MDTLLFGTDGWRDVIADRFTFANVSRAARAYAEHLKDQGQDTVVIGYDTRFNAPLFAQRVAQVMAASGLRALLSERYLPTPALSFAVKHYQAGGGVMLTASHNPPEYLGFKIKGPYGGTATDDIYRDVSDRVATLEPTDIPPIDPAKHRPEPFDIRKPYFAALGELVDVEALRGFHGRLVHDAMGGSAAGWIAGFFKHAKLKIELHELHAVPHPQFYGVNPEPIGKNLASCTAVMRESEAVFATATDGDGDRLGLVLPGGAFFNSHQIFALLLDLMHQKGKAGKVVKTFTVSRIIDRLAETRELELIETPVGFKHIVRAMLADEVLIGGEESGGIGLAGHLPERDAIANSLLLLEAVATSGESIAERFAGLEQDTDWQHAYDRLDLKLAGNNLKDDVLQALDPAPDSFAGRAVESVETLDGIKLNLSGHAWVLFRASGTEPLLRIYCEAASADEVTALLTEAEAFTQRLAS